MSAKNNARRRRAAKRAYEHRIECWLENEPPRWRIIQHYLWKKDKPKPPRGVYCDR